MVLLAVAFCGSEESVEDMSDRGLTRVLERVSKGDKISISHRVPC